MLGACWNSCVVAVQAITTGNQASTRQLPSDPERLTLLLFGQMVVKAWRHQRKATDPQEWTVQLFRQCSGHHHRQTRSRKPTRSDRNSKTIEVLPTLPRQYRRHTSNQGVGQTTAVIEHLHI